MKHKAEWTKSDWIIVSLLVVVAVGWTVLAVIGVFTTYDYFWGLK